MSGSADTSTGADLAIPAGATAGDWADVGTPGQFRTFTAADEISREWLKIVRIKRWQQVHALIMALQRRRLPHLLGASSAPRTFWGSRTLTPGITVTLGVPVSDGRP